MQIIEFKFTQDAILKFYYSQKESLSLQSILIIAYSMQETTLHCSKISHFSCREIPEKMKETLY